MQHVNPFQDHAFIELERALNSETRLRGMQTGMPYVRIREACAQRIQAVSRRNHDRIVALEQSLSELKAAHSGLISNLNAAVELASECDTAEQALALVKEQIALVTPRY